MPPNSADAMALYDSGDVDFVLDAGETEGAVEASSAVVKTVLVNQMATSLSESVRIGHVHGDRPQRTGGSWPAGRTRCSAPPTA